MQSNIAQRPRVFISYSHKDIRIKEKIEQFLLSKIKVEILSDMLISPGENWIERLPEMYNEADVFILLVSQAYISSNIVHEAELPIVLQKVNEQKAAVIPFILDDCLWKEEPYAHLQALPRFGKPFLHLTSDESEASLVQLSEAINQLLAVKQNRKAAQVIKSEKEKRSGNLDLSRCDLDLMPRELLDMPWLLSLKLDNNNITKLENIENLKELRELSLSYNEIEKIENLEQLENLQLLDLKSNRITVIENLTSNTEIATLGLSSNRIAVLQGIKHLVKLRSLYIAHNSITDIRELQEMPQLKRIVLTNNLIKSIRPLLSHIKAGLPVFLKYSYDENEEGVFLMDNKTLSEPAIEVIAEGAGAIIKYFGDAHKYGTRPLQIIKLILVGNSKVGKTNFSEFITGKEMTKAHNSTHLLDIHRWDNTFIKAADDTTISINIFDFGGQDYYHDSHRLYYSHDTAYILLWDTTTNKYSEETEQDKQTLEEFVYENYPLEYWLESINYNLLNRGRYDFSNKDQDDKKAKSTANNPPIFVLQNKIDIQEGKLDQQTLAKKYQNIATFFNVSLAKSIRTEALKNVVKDYMNALDLSGRKLIEYEYKIIDDFLKQPRAFKISTIEDFWQECKDIINDSDVEFNRENAQIIATILNSLGVLFYNKQEGVEDLVITDIKELNERIKKIMDIAKRGNDKGLFETTQLGEIDDKEKLLELLAGNNSIIRLSNNRFLLPQFLPSKPDASIDFFLSAFRFIQVRFVYKAYFHKTLLLSLFSRYVPQSNSTDGGSVTTPLYWRNGIVIQRGEKDNKEMVFVEFLKTESCGTIEIKTMKPYNKRGLEREIEKTLEELSKGWTVTKQISTNCTDFFDLNYLKDEIAKGIFEFGSNGNIFRANDFKLIADFDKLPKKLFISYSSKNGDFIKRFVTHLEVLKSSKLIEPWYDRMIESGTKWDDTIRKEMRNSDIIIFLLSPDFLATEYIMKTEIPLAIEQMQNELSKFFFIELKPSGWKRTFIADFQQTDNPNEIKKNIISIGTPDNDEKWIEVIDELVAKMEK